MADFTYNFTGTLQYQTLAAGTYDIVGYGAAGGAGGGGGAGQSGGNGASAGAAFTFQTETKLIILVGGMGGLGGDFGSGSGGTAGGGGGGGTFVYIDADNNDDITINDILLLAAGGGGGGSGRGSSAGSGAPGGDGSGDVLGSGSGSGGAAGSGGAITGGGGAGVAGSGTSGGTPGSGDGASSIDGAGTSGLGANGNGGVGGFGGGGGGGGGGSNGLAGGGGGGGGYDGGDGGDGVFSATGGGGGTSYLDPVRSAAETRSSADGSNSGDGSVSIACYATGTRIGTACGAICVEDLTIGDHAVTASGEVRPIRWIGHRTYRCQGRRDALPVRIAAGAFGEGRPARDLFVSPAHAIAVDVLGAVLIPACRLVNGTTITQVDVETVIYWHVELDSHDILLAEGLPAESYLDCGNRRFFANADATDLTALPDARPEGPLPFCRPFHEDGPLVDLVRARLRERAAALGWTRVEDIFAGLHLVADGRVIRPDTEDLVARFVLPADASDVRLVSDTSVPAHVLPDSTDGRRLGVAVSALVIDDGLSAPRRVALDDPRLTGFHALDAEATWRWTDGDATLPAALWAGYRGPVFLRVDLAAPAVPRWIAPATETVPSRLQA